MSTSFPFYPADCQNGNIHVALLQADSSTMGLPTPYYGGPSNNIPDEDIISITQLRPNATPEQYALDLKDIVFGKLRYNNYKVITHRRYPCNHTRTDDTQAWVYNSDIYIPIKKRIGFEDPTDRKGKRPFYLMVWFVPHEKRPDEPALRNIVVYHNFELYFNDSLSAR